MPAAITVSHKPHDNEPLEPCIICSAMTSWRVTIPVMIMHVVRPLCEGCRDNIKHAIKLVTNITGTMKVNTRDVE